MQITIEQKESLLNFKIEMFEQNLNQQIIDLKRGNMLLKWSHDLCDWIDIKNLRVDQDEVNRNKAQIKRKIHLITGLALMIRMTDQLSKAAKVASKMLENLGDAMKAVQKAKATPPPFPSGGILDRHWSQNNADLMKW